MGMHKPFLQPGYTYNKGGNNNQEPLYFESCSGVPPSMDVPIFMGCGITALKRLKLRTQLADPAVQHFFGSHDLQP